jgi:hypothetical protein
MDMSIIATELARDGDARARPRGGSTGAVMGLDDLATERRAEAGPLFVARRDLEKVALPAAFALHDAVPDRITLRVL